MNPADQTTDVQIDEEGVTGPIEFVDHEGNPLQEGQLIDGVYTEYADGAQPADDAPADDDTPTEEFEQPEPQPTNTELEVLKKENALLKQAFDKMMGDDQSQQQQQAAPDPLDQMKQTFVKHGYKDEDASAFADAFRPVYEQQQNTITELKTDLQRALAMSANANMGYEQSRIENQLSASNPDLNMKAVRKIVNENLQNPEYQNLSWETHYELAVGRAAKQATQSKARAVHQQQQNKVANRDSADTGINRHQMPRKVKTPPPNLTRSEKIQWILNN